MGCDIHFFVEYKSKELGNWRNLGQEFHLTRHYGVFAALADVRNYGGEVKHEVEPRGIPKDIGWRTVGSYTLYVRDREDADDQEDSCSKESAERWVAQNSSRWWDEEKKTRVTGPDWHSESWMTSDEFDKAINFEIEGKVIRDTEDYKAVLAAMRSLETSGYDVRCVFWFDN